MEAPNFSWTSDSTDPEVKTGIACWVQDGNHLFVPLAHFGTAQQLDNLVQNAYKSGIEVGIRRSTDAMIKLAQEL